MDPISVIFASYLDIVSTSVHEHTTDLLGTEIQAVMVEHQGIKVPYSYHMWRINNQSVCETYQNNFDTYSKCTVAAKSLFADVCDHLQKKPNKHWRKNSEQKDDIPIRRNSSSNGTNVLFLRYSRPG